jgi:hypothetical protein
LFVSILGKLEKDAAVGSRVGAERSAAAAVKVADIFIMVDDLVVREAVPLPS